MQTKLIVYDIVGVTQRTKHERSVAMFLSKSDAIKCLSDYSNDKDVYFKMKEREVY